MFVSRTDGEIIASRSSCGISQTAASWKKQQTTKKKRTKHKDSKALISGKPGGCGEGESLVSAWICYTNGVLKNTPLCICSFLQIEGTRRNKLLVLETTGEVT